MLIKNMPPRMAERGKIKIGMKGADKETKYGKTFQQPIKLDYFRVTTMDTDENNNFIVDPNAIELFGEKPTTLPVRLLFNDVEKNFMSRYAVYQGRKLWCSGDGHKAQRRNGTGMVDHPCPCPLVAPDYTGKDKCKVNGNLSVIIDGMPGVGGVWSFRTTSYNSVQNLMSAMGQIQAITGGQLAGIPLNLVLRTKMASSPTDGAIQKIHIVSLEFPGSMDELEEIGMAKLRKKLEHQIEVRQLEDRVQRLLLPSPTSGVFDGDDEDEIAAEFYPQSGDFDPETGEIKDPAEADNKPKGEDPALAGLINDGQPATQEGEKTERDIPDLPADLDRRTSSATKAKVQDSASAGTDDQPKNSNAGGNDVDRSVERAQPSEAKTTVNTEAAGESPPSPGGNGGQAEGASSSTETGSPPASKDHPPIDDAKANIVRLINPSDMSVEQEWKRSGANVDEWRNALQEILWELKDSPAIFRAWWDLHDKYARGFADLLAKKGDADGKARYSNMVSLIEFAEGIIEDHAKQEELL